MRQRIEGRAAGAANVVRMTRARAIYFDLGGTLFSNHEVARVSIPVLLAAGERLGVEGGLEKIVPAFLEATRVTNERYVSRKSYLHREMLFETIHAFARGLDREADDAFLEWFYLEQRTAMVNDVALRPDCLETLTALRARGLVLVVVSNVDNDYLEPIMQNLGLAPLFDHWISSESAGSCKPDSGIFQQALALSDHRAEEVIFVGDSRVHDVQGARAMGMKTVLLAEGGRSQLDDAAHTSEPDHVIRSLAELLPIADSVRVEPVSA
jgi:HAD superfamily hydrolase (TIGR01509 family)